MFMTIGILSVDNFHARKFELEYYELDGILRQLTTIGYTYIANHSIATIIGVVYS